MPFGTGQGFAEEKGTPHSVAYTFVKVEKPPIHPYLPMPRSQLREPHVTTAAEQDAKFEKAPALARGNEKLGNEKNFYEFVGPA